MKALLVPCDLSKPMEIIEAENWLGLIALPSHNIQYGARVSSDRLSMIHVEMTVDDDGKQRELPVNYRAMLISHYIHVPLVGDVFLQGRGAQGEDPGSVREDILDLMQYLDIDQKAQYVKDYGEGKD